MCKKTLYIKLPSFMGPQVQAAGDISYGEPFLPLSSSAARPKAASLDWKGGREMIFFSWSAGQEPALEYSLWSSPL